MVVCKPHSLHFWDYVVAVPLFVVVKKQKWNSFPKDIQTTVEKLNEEWIEKPAKGGADMKAKGLPGAEVLKFV